jgi:hypothetical protein
LSRDGRFVCKIVKLADGRRLEERVRLFAPGELQSLLEVVDVRVAHEFGDYNGGPLRPGSPRTILIGQVS